MSVDSEIVSRARAYDRSAIELIFAENYPIVHRMAHGLSGRADVGAGVPRFVFKQALRMLPSWKDEGEPERWFRHHTVLTTRRAGKHTPDLTNDVFIIAARTRDAAYPAFIRAIRALPMQQREAFILHHGERFNSRYTAVAMDCSIQAADAHLSAAENSLKTLAGDRFAPFVEEMGRCYRSFTPTESLAIPRIRKQIRRFICPRRVGRFLGWITMIALITAIVWGLLKIRPMLDY